MDWASRFVQAVRRNIEKQEMKTEFWITRLSSWQFNAIRRFRLAVQFISEFKQKAPCETNHHGAPPAFEV